MTALGHAAPSHAAPGLAPRGPRGCRTGQSAPRTAGEHPPHGRSHGTPAHDGHGVRAHDAHGASGDVHLAFADDVPPLRLTPRGRLLAFGACFLLALAALSAGARALAADGPGERVVTVTPGQTLSEIAHAALPTLPVDEAVARVQVANRLSSLQVAAGQTLRVPR